LTKKQVIDIAFSLKTQATEAKVHPPGYPNSTHSQSVELGMAMR